MQNKTAIIGYSGHSYVVADTAISAGLTLDFYCEKTTMESNPFNLDFLGFEGDVNFKGWDRNLNFILGVGDNILRHRIGLEIIRRNKTLLNIVDPTASISFYSSKGNGNFIARQVVINTLAVIGNFCILNTGCIIEHECKIGDGVHIAPGAVLAGNVKIGNNSFIGANSVIKQGITIGSNVIIGAGSVVVTDVADNKTVVGNPGKCIK